MKNKRIYILLAVVAAILLIPLIAMQYTDEVNWSTMDFMVMGAMLLGTGVLIEGAIRTVQKKDNRIAIIALIVLAFLLVWAELAVGIFGTPFAGS